VRRFDAGVVIDDTPAAWLNRSADYASALSYLAPAANPPGLLPTATSVRRRHHTGRITATRRKCDQQSSK